MTALTIPADDHGKIRVFATDAPLPEDAIRKTPRGLGDLFKADLNPDYVDIVQIADLGGMSLSAYIAEGYDLSADPVDKVAVDAIRGTAILVMSRATGGMETVLTPAPGLRHVTTYTPQARIAIPDPLTAEAGLPGPADKSPEKPPKSAARISGMVATFALLAMFALVVLMIWVGG